MNQLVSACLKLGTFFEHVALGEDVVDDVSVDVGQAEVSALVSVGHSFVVDSQLIQNRRVQIVDVDRGFQ